jgi:hypothetical protein
MRASASRCGTGRSSIYPTWGLPWVGHQYDLHLGVVLVLPHVVVLRRLGTTPMVGDSGKEDSMSLYLLIALVWVLTTSAVWFTAMLMKEDK